jgi:CheY-like chemotaxis protein
MYLEYKILWIDDDLQSYVNNGSVRKVEDFLIEKGFTPLIEKVFDVTKLDESLSKYDYDLILSDYKLGDETGDIIIKKIREEKKKDSEILFYTTKSSYKDKPEVKDNLAFIDRLTFHLGRENLIDRIEKIIYLTLKKLLDINATRGLITAVTSELDVEIENIYKPVINKLQCNNELKPTIEKVFKDDYEEVKKYYIKSCKTKRDSHLSDHKKYFSLSDAFRKWKILKELLKLNAIEGFDLSLFKKYNEDVIKIRNKFAHVKSYINDKNKTVLRGQLENEDYEFDEAKCIEIRKKLILHKQNIDKLKNILEN